MEEITTNFVTEANEEEKRESLRNFLSEYKSNYNRALHNGVKSPEDLVHTLESVLIRDVAGYVDTYEVHDYPRAIAKCSLMIDDFIYDIQKIRSMAIVVDCANNLDWLDYYSTESKKSSIINEKVFFIEAIQDARKCGEQAEIGEERLCLFLVRFLSKGYYKVELNEGEKIQALYTFLVDYKKAYDKTKHKSLKPPQALVKRLDRLFELAPELDDYGNDGNIPTFRKEYLALMEFLCLLSRNKEMQCCC